MIVFEIGVFLKQLQILDKICCCFVIRILEKRGYWLVSIVTFSLIIDLDKICCSFVIRILEERECIRRSCKNGKDYFDLKVFKTLNS